MKQIIILSSLLILWLTPLLTAAQYDQDQEFVNALNWMYENELTQYNTIEDFRPWDQLTRQEFAWLLGRYIPQLDFDCMLTLWNRISCFWWEACTRNIAECDEKVQENIKLKENRWLSELTTIDDISICSFKDTGMFDPTLSDSINTVCEYWLMKGYDNEFHPNDILTKAELLTILVRMESGSLPENQIPRWSNYYANAFNNWLTKERDESKIDLPITRYEAALLINRQYWIPSFFEEVPLDKQSEQQILQIIEDEEQKEELKDSLRSNYLRTE